MMSGLDQRQLEYLRAMDIQVWVPGDSVADKQVVADASVANREIPIDTGQVNSALPVSPAPVSPVSISPATVQPDLPRSAEPFGMRAGNVSVPAPAVGGYDDGLSTSSWKGLKVRVTECTACDLHRTRTRIVFGTGDPQADWLIVGEAPGADEEQQGKSFVGSAGQLLNRMLLATGLQREQVYITNIVKCRPTDDRDPRPAEVAQCQAFLDRQVVLLQPRIILAVGRIAAQHLLKTDATLGSLRGKQHQYVTGDGQLQIPVVVTYHPAYLSRSPKEKRKAWQDLQFAVAVSQGSL